MSAERIEWHNVWSLIGNTANRTTANGWHKVQEILTADAGLQTIGGAWHYRAAVQGDEPNHYYGPIPVEDVERRLFGWEPVAVSPMVATYSVITEDGVETISITDGNRQMIVRPRGALGEDDPGGIVGVFKAGYKIHNFREWLLHNVASILDDELSISAAGLLREGAQAWVEVSVPETITTPEGVEFRPVLLAATSLDGSLATGYGRKVQLTVCDNTLAIALAEKGQSIKFKHTTNSLNRIGEAREALAIVHTIADDFAAEVAQLTNTTVTDEAWAQFLDAHELTTLKDAKGNAKEKASKTHAMNRRAEFEQLYRYDERCKPWIGTAFGVLQAVNTHKHHVATVRGMSRPMRNADMAITGGIDALDRNTLDTLTAVLA
jgi:phage/plasmid-like protein (TIGR03299 family)